LVNTGPSNVKNPNAGSKPSGVDEGPGTFVAR
jgi:hypothetical protein